MQINASSPDEEVPVFALEPRRFGVEEKEEMKKHFEEEGYVVVRDVATKPELDKAEDLFWEFLEGTEMGAKRGDPTTWDTINWPPNSLTGLFVNQGMGQSEFMWHLRSLPPVRAAFENLWDETDLIVSFDGGNAFRPWQQRFEWRTTGGWYHVDQSAHIASGLQTIQGFVNVLDATPLTGGLVVIPKSHKQHNEFCERAAPKNGKKHFCLVPRNDPILSMDTYLILAKAGDLVLWDSRTVHCNTPGMIKKESWLARLFSKKQKQESELLRIVAYICMGPRKRATDEVLKKRQEAMISNITCTHWPHEFRIASLAKDLPPNTIKLTPQQQALV